MLCKRIFFKFFLGGLGLSFLLFPAYLLHATVESNSWNIGSGWMWFTEAGDGNIHGNVNSPVDALNVANKDYVDTNDFWELNGSDIYKTNSGNVGIGTTNPAYLFSVDGYGNFEQPVTVGTPTNDTHAATKSYVDDNSGGVSYWDENTDGDIYNTNSGGVLIDDLQIGSMSFGTNAGKLSWVDMPVTSDASAGTVESYSAQIDGNPLLTVYGESDGSGGVQNTGVGIGTDSPGALLDVAGTSEFNGIINTQNNWISGDGDAEGISIDNDGNVGIGTTSPSYALDVSGGGNFDNPVNVGTPTDNSHAVTKSYVDSNELYLPDDPATSDVDMNGNDLVGVNAVHMNGSKMIWCNGSCPSW